jgi:hypothetical protein
MIKRGLASQQANRLQTLDKKRGTKFSNPINLADNLTHSVTADDDDGADESQSSTKSTLSEFESHLDVLESELREDIIFNPSMDEDDI